MGQNVSSVVERDILGIVRPQGGGFDLGAFEYDPLTSVKYTEGSPIRFLLDQNYPNPFNPETGIRYQVSGSSDVKLVVYDLVGREVAVLAKERKAPGSYEVQFDASGLASGVYLYRLTAGEFVETRKLLLLR